jgi:hypothetical protein
MQREGGCVVVRQGCRVVIMLVVLVALLCPSPANANPKLPPGVPVTGTGQSFVKVKAGTPVAVLGLDHEPANPDCHPPTLNACQAHTYAIVQLPNGKVVALDSDVVNFQTQTVRVVAQAGGPLTPKEVNRSLGLSDTGGVAISPLLGAVILIGSVLVARRMIH